MAASANEGNLDLHALGKVVYNTGVESCRSCHGSDGQGTERSSVDLSDPNSWKSITYADVLTGSDSTVSQESIVRTLIRMGAKGWNDQNFNVLKTHFGQAPGLESDRLEPEPYDEEMVGLSAANKKVLTRRAVILMKRAGLPRAKPNEIEDLLAASVLHFIEQEFVR